MSFFDDPPLRDFPDHALRRLLENPANLRDLVAALRPDLAARMDFSRLQPEPREFLMEDWRKRECDLFFRVPYRTGDKDGFILICLLLEHQSSPDPRMPLRTLVYAVSYWEREWKEWEDRHDFRTPLVLTPVLPIVFYTGNTPWNASRQLVDLFPDLPELRAFVPQWPMLFWDLSAQDPNVLLSSASAWLQALAVVRTEEEELATFEAAFQRVCEGLDRLQSNEKMRALDLLWFVLSWVLRRRPSRDHQRLQAVLKASVAGPGAQEEVERMGSKLGKTLEEEVAERSRLQAKREILRIQLEDRFSPLPEALLNQIETCQDEERLTAWARQVPRINSLADLQLE